MLTEHSNHLHITPLPNWQVPPPPHSPSAVWVLRLPGPWLLAAPPCLLSWSPAPQVSQTCLLALFLPGSQTLSPAAESWSGLPWRLPGSGGLCGSPKLNHTKTHVWVYNPVYTVCNQMRILITLYLVYRITHLTYSCQIPEEYLNNIYD